MSEFDVEDWGIWAKHVLFELKRHNSLLETYESKLEDIRIDIELLKLKAAGFGAVAGFVVILVKEFLLK